MNTTSTGLTEVSLRKIAALLGAVALSAAVLSGCGGESSAEGNSAGTSSEQESGDSKKSAGDGLPEDFPDDVILPEFTSAKKIGGGADSGFWSVLLMLESSTETPVDDYAAQLTDAGYTVETDTGTTVGTGPTWEVSFHSSMDGTLTVGVTKK